MKLASVWMNNQMSILMTECKTTRKRIYLLIVYVLWLVVLILSR
jgi:hypothetical protein